MLTLLTPQQIDQDKNGTANEIQRRVWGLAEEESTLVGNINALRLEEKAIETRIQQREQTNESTYNTRKSILIGEVEELERRRAKAMQPVSKLLEEAKQYLEANKAESEKIGSTYQALEARQSKITEREENLLDREDELSSLESKIKGEFTRREQGLIAAETEIKLQTQKLSANWIEYHTAVAATNEVMSDRESRVIMDAKANESVREQLNAQKADQDQRERQLQDRYATLGLAIKEFEKKKKSHG